MRQKKTFKIILVFLALFLTILPFLVSFNEVLTQLIEKLELYGWLQEKVVPLEVRMVGVLVRPFKIHFVPYERGMAVNDIYTQLSWNCLGWQSLLLLAITLLVGLRGNYALGSKLETILMGLLGTFLINLLRIAFTVILLAKAPTLFSIVFHDYLAAIVAVVWLAFFWWFSYSFVLEERELKSGFDSSEKGHF